MIISRITMGLGNQMFQYAAGLALSLEKNVELKLDVFSYNGYKLRKYELDNFFNINNRKATQEEIAKYDYNHPVKRGWNRIFPGRKMRTIGLPYEEPFLQRTLLSIHDLLLPSHQRKTYLEPHYHYDRNFFQAKDDVYLNGYWMSWKYFKKYDEVIRNAFSIKRELVSHLDDFVQAIRQVNSVSLHIRRTDYTDPEVVQLKGITPVQYYLDAVQYIQQKRDDIVIYAFSDDISWAKENLKPGGLKIHFVDHMVSNSAIEDFYLMTQCGDNIITNSTFSWWAAYLNGNENKIVVCPKKWYSKSSHYNYKDVYPTSWVTIDN